MGEKTISDAEEEEEKQYLFYEVRAFVKYEKNHRDEAIQKLENEDCFERQLGDNLVSVYGFKRRYDAVQNFSVVKKRR